MGFSSTFFRLARECQRHTEWYRNATQDHPVLGQYVSPRDVVEVLSAASRPMRERNELLFALVCAQRTIPHALWQSVLVLAFAPLLQRLRSTAWGLSGRELDQQILVFFLHAISQLGTSSDRIAMHIRQRTERALFRELRREVLYRKKMRNRGPLSAAGPCDPEILLPELTIRSDPFLSAALQAIDRGELRALVRQRHPDAEPLELERAYRRIQRRRCRFFGAIRSQGLKPKRALLTADVRRCRA
jgi:hypothetical protein